MTISELIETKLEKLQSRIYVPLIIVITIGLFLRIYFTPWHIPSNSPDAFVYMIEGLSYAKGDFTNISRILWPLFLSLFFVFFKFEDYIGYMTVMRIVSICVSVSTVPVLYLIAKYFVEKKYAIITTVFFIVEPNIIENSIFAISESFFILLGLTSFYFIIQKNQKYFPIAFIFAALAFDVRLNGIVLFLLLLLVCGIRIKPLKKKVKTILIGTAIFLIIISPYIILPIKSGAIPFSIVGEIGNSISKGSMSVSTYVQSEDPSSFSILKNALKNEFLHIFRISVPYLVILFPFGVVTALTNLAYERKILFAVIIISLIIAIPQYTVSNEYRNLFFLTPFLCILSSIGLQKLTVSIEMKNIFLVLLMAGLVLLSGYFLLDRYNVDQELVMEKYNLGKYIANNFQGRIIGHLRLEIIQNMPDIKTGQYFFNQQLSVADAGITINTIPKLMEYVIQNKVDFLVMEDILDEKHYPIFADVFYNEGDFPYLEKVFDSYEHGYKKVKIKIFKIDYVKYDDFIKQN